MSSTTTPIAIDDFVLAIKDLSDENITSVKSQLLNSISKLTESNELLETEISTTKEAIAQLNPDQSHQSLAEDLELYQESIEENKIVITSQRERVTALDAEMTSRGLLSQKQEEQTKSDEIYL
ncbi:translation machinery-associated protein 17 [[Candida] anglica]|uniref:Translation machinery-associated protein 17 n=1 Tax=[Candida] anglica TaxID=148631 RepID=A0ABP0EML4_9ASCO